jgi:hypothetical protein
MGFAFLYPSYVITGKRNGDRPLFIFLIWLMGFAFLYPSYVITGIDLFYPAQERCALLKKIGQRKNKKK